jgi:pyrroloquinoline quinone (PQQ) biosynthesis protein C
MSFHSHLIEATARERDALTRLPIVADCLAGRVALSSYHAFLREAYHHVRQTVPLLRATRDALRPHQQWLIPALDEYIEEEAGHEHWVLDDLKAAGVDAEAVRLGDPGPATAAMVDHAWAQVRLRNPVGFFGMVLVLEGTSVALALRAADAIQRALALPDQAFSYLRSHGTLDQEHVGFFELLMDRIDSPDDQRDIIEAARAFYRLYGAVFESIPRLTAELAIEELPA